MFGNKGSLTVQFLLGFVLILSFVALFLMMTLTLSVSEIVQYITYSSSRQLFLGHSDKSAQIEKAKKKYDKLTKEDFQFKFDDNFLIKITPVDDWGPNTFRGLNNSQAGFAVQPNEPNLFYGVWTDFNPKLLSVDTLWGSTDIPDPELKTTIGSYLGREPTKDECEKFNQERWNKIQGWINNAGVLRPRTSSNSDGADSDNGC